MSRPSLLWIDWGFHGRSMGRETAGRFLVALFVASYFLAMLLSGGVDRFLSEQYTMTAILRIGVPDEEGAGIEGKVTALPPVKEARYRNPEEAWKEILDTYPGLESLRSTGKNPLPGYVEIRLRPGNVSEEGIEVVRSALEPFPQVEKVLSGGAVIPRLLRMKRWANVLLWTGFALSCGVFLVILSMQEKARAARIVPEVSFLVDRGVPKGRIVARRTAGAFVTGGGLALLATVSSFGVLFVLSDRFPLLRVVVGPAQELLDSKFALPLVLFLFFAAVLQGLVSYAGWHAAAPQGR